MRKFFKKISFYYLIILIIIISPLFFINKYHGNSIYNVKHEYISKNLKNKGINTVIFGSSRMYRQIDPDLLDNLLKEYATSTFNMGSVATFNPETLFLYEQFLNEIDDNSIKYSFVELQLFTNIGKQNIYTERSSYWLNLKYLKLITLYYLQSDNGKRQKFLQISNYYKAFLYKIFSLNKYNLLFENKESSNYLGKNLNGYYPLDQEMKDAGGINEYTKRSKNYVLDSFKSKKTKPINRTAKPKNINSVLLEKLIKIIEISKKKGIHVFFIVPPKGSDLTDKLEYLRYIPKENIMNISSKTMYPLLYTFKYGFDSGHLNEKGAKLFTGYIAEEFRTKVKNNP